VFKDGTSVKKMIGDKEKAEAHYRFTSRVGLAFILAGFACQLVKVFLPKNP
jgi:hypothetical protein